MISGPLNDWICVYLTKKNKGVYEPEFRLVLVVVVTILGTVGFFGFGATVHYQTHWLGPVLTFGLANMSLAFASTCVFGYVIDCESASKPGPRQLESGCSYTRQLELTQNSVPETERRSIRGHQRTESVDLWADLFCQQLAGTGRTAGSVLCPRGSFLAGVPLDGSLVVSLVSLGVTPSATRLTRIKDIRQEDSVLDREERVAAEIYE